GNTWASTYADVPRTLNELGEFSTITKGVIFHNKLASSDYGFLKHGTFEPCPNYFAVLLWNRLMGKTCYQVLEKNVEGAHVYCHSRKDGKDGKVYLVINNSWTETTTVEFDGEAQVYALTGKNGMRSRTMCLNGKELCLEEKDELPNLEGQTISGKVEIAPGGCTFIVL
ncbi:MAG: beta-glucuronidase, partial [Clostridia bacterium]|nr:beta-glucuronidase [Clostridia bacterium]